MSTVPIGNKGAATEDTRLQRLVITIFITPAILFAPLVMLLPARTPEAPGAILNLVLAVLPAPQGFFSASIFPFAFHICYSLAIWASITLGLVSSGFVQTATKIEIANRARRSGRTANWAIIGVLAMIMSMFISHDTVPEGLIAGPIFDVALHSRTVLWLLVSFLSTVLWMFTLMLSILIYGLAKLPKG
jgi:hypothetical protein